MTATNKCLTAGLSICLAAGLTQAQSLDGDVVRDPNAGLAIYTIDIDGPPAGFAQVFLGLGLQPPLHLNPFGPWYLDPFFVLPVTPVTQLDPLGQLHVPLVLDLDLSGGVLLTFQCVNIDVANNIRLSNDAVGLQHNAAPAPKNFDYAFAYDTGGSELRVAGSAPPGAVVEVRVVNSNGTVSTAMVTVPANGKFALNQTVPGGITQNEDVHILCNGTLVEKVDLYKF